MYFDDLNDRNAWFQGAMDQADYQRRAALAEQQTAARPRGLRKIFSMKNVMRAAVLGLLVYGGHKLHQQGYQQGEEARQNAFDERHEYQLKRTIQLETIAKQLGAYIHQYKLQQILTELEAENSRPSQLQESKAQFGSTFGMHPESSD